MNDIDRYRHPGPQLLRRYTFTCPCGRVLAASPSISQEMGINSGQGSCPSCKAFLHLEITPDLHGCMMVAEPFDSYFTRAYPESAS